MLQTFEFTVPLKCLRDDLQKVFERPSDLKHPKIDIWYKFESRFDEVLSIQMPPALLGCFKMEKLEHLQEQIEIAARHHYESTYENKSYTTTELNEKAKEGQYE